MKLIKSCANLFLGLIIKLMCAVFINKTFLKAFRVATVNLFLASIPFSLCDFKKLLRSPDFLFLKKTTDCFAETLAASTVERICYICNSNLKS